MIEVVSSDRGTTINIMKCAHCEVACATLECSECKIAGDQSDEKCQLCEECSDLIHKGKMKHTVTPRPINARKNALRQKLQKLAQESVGLRRRKKEMGSLRGDLQNHIRDKEQELRRVVQELQQRVKDKCRTLYLQLKEEINGQCTQLTDQENMLDTHIHAIDELQGEMEKTIQELDEDEFLEALADMEAKIASHHLENLPAALPQFTLKRMIDVCDIDTKIQDICVREPTFDEDPLRIPAIEVSEGMSIHGNVYGRMSKDGTFLLQPCDVDGDKLYHSLNIISASIKKSFIENMDWQTLQDSGTEAAVGEHLFVMDDEYNLWLRGRVEEIRPDGHCQILFTDYGNIKPVSADKLLPKRPSLYDNFPSQTIECTVFDGPKFDIPNSARWAFADTLHDAQSPCTCEIKSKVGVESGNRDLWTVEITIDVDGAVTNINQLVNAKIDDAAQGKGAITCRDVRLTDNPEVYMKLTTLTIEQSTSEKNTGEDKTDSKDNKSGMPANISPQNVASSNSDPTLQQQLQPCVAETSPKSGNKVPNPTTPTPATPPNSDSPVMNVSGPEDAGRYGGEYMKESEKVKDGSDGEEQEHLHQRHADSPSCDDYQSAASSLDEAASGSITPVSASSHISNLPLQVQDGVGELEQEEAVGGEGQIKSEKRKKKKKRRDSERSGEERNGEDEKPNAEPEQAPVQEDKPFILSEWLKHMGTELPEHKKLRSNLQEKCRNVQKFMLAPNGLQPGDLVIVLDERDMWQRAVVTAIKGKKTDVHFIDTPKEKTIPSDNYMKGLFPRLGALPPAVYLPDYVQEVLYRRHGQSEEPLREPVGMPAPTVQQLGVDSNAYMHHDDQDSSRRQSLPRHFRQGGKRQGYGSRHSPQYEPSDSSYDHGEGYSSQPDDSNNPLPHGPPHQSYVSHGSSSRGPIDGRPRRPNDRGENGEWRKHREISCYNCQQSGHVMHDCPHPQRSGARDGGNRRVNKGGGRDNKKRQQRNKTGKGRHDDRGWGRPSGGDSAGPRQQSDNSRSEEPW